MNSRITRNVFCQTIEVRPEHLDVQKHVNNSVYIQWVQDIAVEHWRERTADLDTDDGYWVVLEHHIQYKRQVFSGEQLTVETYVEKPQGIRFPRLVNFYRDDQLVVAARTLWCWVDAASHRPKRIPREIQEVFQIES